MNNQIHSARWVQRNHTQSPDAFGSGEIGALGVIAEGTPHLLRKDIPDDLPSLLTATPATRKTVPLLPASLDFDTSLLEAVAGIGASGLVVEGVGGGHVSGDAAAVMGRLAEQMPVVFAARPRSGAALTRTYGSPGAELDLMARGCIPAGFLNGPKARILLALLLRMGLGRDEIEAAFRKVAMVEAVEQTEAVS